MIRIITQCDANDLEFIYLEKIGIKHYRGGPDIRPFEDNIPYTLKDFRNVWNEQLTRFKLELIYE